MEPAGPAKDGIADGGGHGSAACGSACYLPFLGDLLVNGVVHHRGLAHGTLGLSCAVLAVLASWEHKGVL